MSVTGTTEVEVKRHGIVVKHDTAHVAFTKMLPPIANLPTAIDIVVRDAGGGWQAADFVDWNGNKCMTVLFHSPYATKSRPQCQYCGATHNDKASAKSCEEKAFDDMMQYAYNG